MSHVYVKYFFFKRALQKHQADSSDESDYTPYVPLKDRRKQQVLWQNGLLNLMSLYIIHCDKFVLCRQNPRRQSKY